MVDYFLTDDAVFKNFFRINDWSLKLTINELLYLNVDNDKISFINNDIYTGPDNKKVYLDLSVELDNGEQVIIEMQNACHSGLSKRIQYYLCKRVSDELNTGEEYDNIKTVYGIYFVNFTNMEEYNKLISRYSFHDKKFGVDASDCLIHAVIVNLNYIDQCDEFGISENLKMFLKFMKSRDESELKIMAKENEKINDAYNDLLKINADADFKAYQLVLDKQERDKKQYGIDLKNEGIEQGTLQGQLDARKDMINNMFKNGMSIEDISKFNSISIEEINKLLESVNNSV